ncbi:conserved hypothetical protein [Talaromyces stipitatus ATCC 10500]|uniref:Rhodopsin domain-containing protein n=1 Tax=Talaromyces stipitatus (strain ATCC 10500 / CBS 375.48 / QM 6759 / NRRL 1006) TaxID=441959 RepID=B8MI32_TALSN|nr:uncharacterized protein TSTA_022480 [Talaromyces stipitatus ATCC 10500]EED17194.1 conserved hypothetical protein [Talaromyces stipitatus ATCC 10500]
MSSQVTTTDTNRASELLIPTILTTIVAFIITALRIYVRMQKIKLLGWDDFFNVLAMVTTCVVMGLVIGGTSNGIGRHIQFLEKDLSAATYSIMLMRIAESMLIISTVFVKISISLFLKRLFPTDRRWNTFFWAFIVFNTVTSLVDAAVIFPQCTPVEFNWNKSIDGHCWSDTAINALGIAQGTIAAATDFNLSILPTVFLWNIKIIWRVKIGVCAIMALGFAYVGLIVITLTLTVNNQVADVRTGVEVLPLRVPLEATFGVIAAAAPSIRPLLGHNSVTATYSKSDPRSRSVPLNTMSRSGQRSHHSWLPSQRGQMQELPDDDLGSDGGSQSRLWANKGHGIVKTTDVQVFHSARDGGADRSSDEMLVSDVVYQNKSR